MTWVILLMCASFAAAGTLMITLVLQSWNERQPWRDERRNRR